MPSSFSVELINNMKHLMWHMRKIDNEVITKYDLSFNEFAVFRTIAYRKKVTPKQLSECLKMYHSNLTGVVDKLVDKDLVERTRDTQDRRVVNIQMSEKGHETKKRIDLDIEKRIKDYCDELPQDMLERANVAIEEVIASIEEATR